MQTKSNLLFLQKRTLHALKGFALACSLFFFFNGMFLASLQAQAGSNNSTSSTQNLALQTQQADENDAASALSKHDYLQEFKDLLESIPEFRPVPREIIDQSTDLMEILKAIDKSLVFLPYKGNYWEVYDGVNVRGVSEHKILCMFDDYRCSGAFNKHTNEIPLELVDRIYYGKGKYLYRDFRDIPMAELDYINLVIFTKEGNGCDLLYKYFRVVEE